MKAPVFSLNGEKVKTITLPKVFETPIRLDLINRVFFASLANSRQPQGRDPRAGLRSTAECWGPGYGVARVPRVKGERHPRAAQGAIVTSARGGHRVHVPTVEKIIKKKINKKEKRLAVASAIAATAIKDLVAKRGHRVDNVVHIPLIVEDKFQELKRTSDVLEVFEKLGLIDDIKRAKNGIKVRAGKGKMRGRRYQRKKSVLIVVSKDNGIYKAARNIPGVDIVNVKDLSVIHLAPGGHAGRLTLWTESTLKQLEERFCDLKTL